MRPRIFRSSTEIAAKSVRKTPSKAAMLIRLETIAFSQSGRPESRDKIQCFALIKIWSSESLKVDEEKGGWLFNQERTRSKRLGGLIQRRTASARTVPRIAISASECSIQAVPKRSCTQPSDAVM